jgi:hypothetical protein
VTRSSKGEQEKEGQMNYPDYHRLEGLRTRTDAQMLLCQASIFTPDGVNITKQPERTNLEPTEIANVSAETQGITNSLLLDEIINKPSIVTNDTRPAISQENVNDLARCEKALLEFRTSVYRIKSRKRNEEDAEMAFASYAAN